ncbi:MAG TPA: sigma-70 family RNA polymerase sigma factor [Acidimicrobiia bacterium]|nr:sigma-70 family RNA polymerase sigma factor [Acidimicrobiia bacterium]
MDVPRRPRTRRDQDVDPEFERLFRREFVPLVQTAYGIVGDWEVAKELAADGFVALLKHWSKVGGYDNPGSWLRRVVIRDAVRSRRRNQRHAPVPPAPDLGATDGVAVRAAVLKLPIRQRAVVVLHYLDDLPVSEVAAVLGCSEGTVKTHLHRARRSLAATLGEEIDDDAR